MATIFALYQSARFVESNKFNQLHRVGEARSTLYAKSLKDSLEKYRPIPYLLSRDTRIKQLLEKTLQPIRVNPHLEDFGHAGNSLIYVLDAAGNTVASSNWRQPETLVGHNFGFRPYFLDAKDGNPGSYYAIGIKTGLPGFFISYPVLQEGRFLGVVVVKVDLEQLQEAWRQSGETIIVSDAFGVLFLSSHPEWKYRCLRQLSDKTTHRLQQTQYPQQPLTPLHVTRMEGKNSNIVTIGTDSFLENSEQLYEYGWRIHYLADLAPVTASFRQALIIGSGVVTTIFFTSLYIRERRQRQRARRVAKEAKAVKQLNERLRTEIEHHKKTEQNLKQTQEELIQASKLAALGRMSAAIAHELNQPVTAIRTFLASCKILLNRNKVDDVSANLAMIGDLTERMAAVTGQLKTFARKGSSAKELVELKDVVKRALDFWAPQLQLKRISISFQSAEELSIVRGDPLQLEQVVNNLIQNGVDAMQHSEKKVLTLTIKNHRNEVILSCQDTGSGIDNELISSIFDPFFTTKEIGQGLGLGLSISYGIISEMGGTISVENSAEGGALFSLFLPMAQGEEGGPLR